MGMEDQKEASWGGSACMQVMLNLKVRNRPGHGQSSALCWDTHMDWPVLELAEQLAIHVESLCMHSPKHVWPLIVLYMRGTQGVSPSGSCSTSSGSVCYDEARPWACIISKAAGALCLRCTMLDACVP